MTYEQDLALKMGKYYQDIVSGKTSGITTGFQRIDRATGRIEPGQLWVVGGYSGVGKSYFILNMINRILDKSDANITVFTTELSAKAYSLRHAFMRAGIWKRDFENNPKFYSEGVKKFIVDYATELIASKRLKIVAVSSFEDIVKELENHKCDLAFIDYVQELSVAGRFGAKDAMPVIAGKLKDLAIHQNIGVVVASQITNSSTKTSFDGMAPFDYGKELNRAAHVSIVLSRKWLENEGKLSKELEVMVIKSREGEPAVARMEIHSGYRVKDATEIS